MTNDQNASNMLFPTGAMVRPQPGDAVAEVNN